MSGYFNPTFNPKRGTKLPKRQVASIAFDPNTGYRRTENWRSGGQPEMERLFSETVKRNVSCQLTYNQGGTATLDVTDPSAEYTLDKWEVVANQEERDLFSHPKVLQLLNDNQVVALRTYIENRSAPYLVFGGLDPDGVMQDGDPLLSPFRDTVIQRFYSLFQRGSTAYGHEQYVLRHTTNASASWTKNIADFGIKQIYTTAQLLTECQDSGLWVFPLPTRLAYKIASLTDPTPKDNYLTGWLKSASTESNSSIYRVDIVTEYSRDQWSSDIYDPYAP